MEHKTYGDVHGALKVGELIEKLRALPQEARVIVEGCDCNGPCTGAVEELHHDQESGHQRRVVLIRRAKL